MKKKYKIGIIPGDGIGRDVIKAAQIILDTVNDVAETFALDFMKMDTGEAAFEKYGDPFPKETRDGIAQTDAVLFGAAGNPYTVAVLMGFRLGFNLYANVRPIKSLPGTKAIHTNADLIVLRENTEGLYRGLGWIDGDYHVNLRVFTTQAMERILRFCFEYALKEGRKKVTFTHKAHVLIYTDEPMRQMFYEIAKEYPDIEADDMTIDACAMQMGFAYSGNIGDSMGVFEPIHGTAPKYADKNVVNPSAAILAGRMMFNYLGENETALGIEQALKDVLVEGKVRTYDLGGNSSTTAFAEAVSERIRKNVDSSR
jgi:3-isopropylmalate dehydrogenase